MKDSEAARLTLQLQPLLLPNMQPELRSRAEEMIREIGLENPRR